MNCKSIKPKKIYFVGLHSIEETEPKENVKARAKDPLFEKNRS